jgi:NAD(P)-dependent dehydrogenase (short-subunit alcohol dehydrogenase family)
MKRRKFLHRHLPQERGIVKSLFDLNSRVVLATGANRGIGLGFLIGCARQCADVVVWDRDQSRQAAALSKLKEAGAGRTHSETVDVSDEAAVEAAFAATLTAMGRAACVFLPRNDERDVPRTSSGEPSRSVLYASSGGAPYA